MTPEEQEAIEDKRQAVNMAAALSGQLITAALGMIALQGAYVAFADDKKQCGLWFWLLMLVAFVGFVASVFCGGKGTAALYKPGAEGRWDYALGKKSFNKQAGFCLFGILLFIIAVCVARSDKSSDAEAVQKQLETVVQGLEKQSVINQQVFSQLQTNQLQKQVQKPAQKKTR